MRQSRFFVPFDLQTGKHYTMPESVGHYMGRVLRLPVGASVTLFCGDNCEYLARICEASKKAIVLEIVECKIADRESPLAIHLIQAVSKGDKMDWVIQKAVELGVTSLYPVTTSRTNFSLLESRLEKKMLHWRGVISSACEQCGRNQLPEIKSVDHILDTLNQFRDEPVSKIVLNPRGSLTLTKLNTPQNGQLVLLIGPEGGFDEEEIAYAEQCGFISCRLGERILRTETAAVSMLSLAQGMWGDLG